MCTMIAERVAIEGSGKGRDGWFALRQANVSYDHPFHAAMEHALNIDFVNEAQGPGARVAVELSVESARTLVESILTVLERKGVFSFHACGIQDREDGTVFLVLGERGSGKSALLLAALDSGRYLSFGTEIVHAGVENNELTFYRGCLRNNVRLGHLLYDFPALAEAIGVSFNEVEDPWGTKVQLDFGTYAIHADRITAPRLVLVIPRIEEELRDALVTEVPAERMARLKRNLLENLSDKIISMALAYETVPIGSLDTPEGLRRRQRFVDFMVDTGTIARAVNLFASPKNCLEGLHA